MSFFCLNKRKIRLFFAENSLVHFSNHLFQFCLEVVISFALNSTLHVDDFFPSLTLMIYFTASLYSQTQAHTSSSYYLYIQPNVTRIHWFSHPNPPQQQPPTQPTRSSPALQLEGWCHMTVPLPSSLPSTFLLTCRDRGSETNSRYTIWFGSAHPSLPDCLLMDEDDYPIIQEGL